MNRRWRLKWGMILPWFACVPLLLAFWGYFLANSESGKWQADMSGYAAMIAQSLYGAVQIYGLSVNTALMEGRGAGYLQLEIARWLALVVTSSVLANLIIPSVRRLRALTRTFRKDAVAVHGDESRVALLKRQLGSRAIAGDMPEKFRAPTHILAFESSRSMYQYINQNHESFFGQKGKKLYLCTLDALHTCDQDGEILVSNVAENCARRYWEDHWLRRGEKRVAIIGFHEYGRSILTQALLVNVYQQNREIRYTVYGDGSEFLSLHPGVQELVSLGAEAPGRDSLFFCAGPWTQYAHELRASDRIILCKNSDEENLVILDQLLEHGIGGRIDVRAVSAVIPQRIWNLGDLSGGRGIGVFGTDEQLYAPDVIMQETLQKRAKLIHARYIRRSERDNALCKSRKCGRSALKCLECEAFKKTWKQLDAFKRSSNIAQADHMSVKIREVLGEDTAITTDALRAYWSAYDQKSPEEKKKLSELEHIRWMRYHIFHGWSYDPTRDDRRKRHNLMLPYDKLPENQWVKDEDAYTMIPEICQAEGVRSE